MKNVTIITDGSCLGNGKAMNYGGWAAILIYRDRKGQDHRAEFTGGDFKTTNNRMELSAVIGGMSKLTEACNVTIITDSTYVCNTLGNVPKFAQNNWHYPCGTGKPKNDDMLKSFWQLLTDKQHKVQFQHINGHSGNPDNERADALAKAEARALKALEAAE